MGLSEVLITQNVAIHSAHWRLEGGMLEAWFSSYMGRLVIVVLS
jgi:hypothetical protein